MKLAERNACRPLDEARRCRGSGGERHGRHLELLPEINLRSKLADGVLALHDLPYRAFAFCQPGRQRFATGRCCYRAEPLRDRTGTEEIEVPGGRRSRGGIRKQAHGKRFEATLQPSESLLVDGPPRGAGALAPDDTFVPGDEAGESSRPDTASNPGCKASGSQACDAEAAADEEEYEGREAGPGDAEGKGRRPPLGGRRCRRPRAIDRPGTGARRHHGCTIARRPALTRRSA